MRALVTGGAKRLGSAIAIALAKLRYSVVVHYRDSLREAEQTAQQCRALGVDAELIQGDLSTPEQASAFAARYLDQYSDTALLVNNVGNYLTKSAMHTSTEEWLGLFNLNLHAPFILTKALMPSLSRPDGQVINLGVSGLLSHKAPLYASAYMIAKHGLWELTRSLARELAPQGVRVNMVSPGQLDISVDLFEKERTPPIGFPSTCEEVCRAITFLVDPANRSITGQNIEVAGGLGL
jgi:NAD(P)-dependent dehydrogenase (short-subunit alcohol dehydrogenase family)